MGQKREIKYSLYQWCVDNNRMDWLKHWDYDKTGFGPEDVESGSATPIYFTGYFYFDENNELAISDTDLKYMNCYKAEWDTRPTEISRDRGEKQYIPYMSEKNPLAIPGLTDLQSVLPSVALEFDEEKNRDYMIGPNGTPASTRNIPYNSKVPYYWTTYIRNDAGQIVKQTWLQSPLSRLEDLKRQEKDFTIADRIEETQKSYDSFSEEEGSDLADFFEFINAFNQPAQSNLKLAPLPKITNDLVGNSERIRCVQGFNDLMSTNPTLYYELDRGLCEQHGIDPYHINKDTTIEVPWIDKGTGNIWWASPASRIAGRDKNPYQSKHYHTSFPEQAIYYYIKKYYPDAVSGDRTILEGKELDIYIPSLNFAIEYDGQYWHTDVERDTIKNEMCDEKGINLIRIREPKCPELAPNPHVRMMQMENGTTKDKELIIKYLLEQLGVEVKADTVNIKRDSSEILGQYISEVNKDFPDGHLLLNGSAFKDVIPPEIAYRVKTVRFTNYKTFPLDQNVDGGQKFPLSEDSIPIVGKNGEEQYKIMGWLKGDTFIISTCDESNIYLDEKCYNALSVFPNIENLEVKNVKERTPNDKRQLLFPFRNRDDVKIYGCNVRSQHLREIEPIDIFDEQDLQFDIIRDAVTEKVVEKEKGSLFMASMQHAAKTMKDEIYRREARTIVPLSRNNKRKKAKRKDDDLLH